MLVPRYLTEISPVALRRATVLFHQLFIAIGILTSQILGVREILGTNKSWHLLLSAPIVSAAIGSLLLLAFLNETPKGLLNAGDEQTARIGKNFYKEMGLNY